MSSDIRLVYVTAEDESEAVHLGSRMVEENLAACMNVLGDIRSFFRWHGDVEDAHETAFLLKTTEPRVERLIHRLRELHKYDVPCILVFPVETGAEDFMNWIREETRKN